MDGKTFDFGLGDDEDFAPPVAPDDERLGDPHIMTALGPVEPGALGATILRGTILRTPPDGGALDSQDRLDDPHVTLSELENAQYAGLAAIVDFTTIDDGLDAAGARWVAERTALHVVLATGARPPAAGEAALSSRAAGAGARGASPDALAAEMVRDMTVGLGGSSARAGLISIPADPVWIAAARIAGRTVAGPVTIQIATLAQLDAALTSAALAGIPAERTIVAGLSGAWPIDALRRVTAAGAWALIDRLSGDWDADQLHARAIADLMHDGATRVLVGCDLRTRRQWRAWNGQPGMGYLIAQFAVALMERGLSGLDVRRILVEAPNDVLVSRRLTP